MRPLRRQTLYPTELQAHEFILRDLRFAKPAFVVLSFLARRQTRRDVRSSRQCHFENSGWQSRKLRLLQRTEESSGVGNFNWSDGRSSHLCWDRQIRRGSESKVAHSYLSWRAARKSPRYLSGLHLKCSLCAEPPLQQILRERGKQESQSAQCSSAEIVPPSRGRVKRDSIVRGHNCSCAI